MSQTLQELLALANEAAEISNIDMSETSSGGGAKRILPAGWAIGTLVEVVELGKHIGEYNGKPKAKADLLFRLGFALTGATHYLNEDGSPYIFRTFDLSLGNNEKSKAKIAFDRMNYLQTAKHFAQLLGKSFLVEIKVDKGKKDPTKEFNSINYATINKPFDPMSNQPYPTPALDTLPFRLFLWDKPTKEGWDSLFIDGVNDQGKSRNYIQEICLRAADFPGSSLEQLIGGGIPDITAPAALVPVSPAVAAITAPPELPGIVVGNVPAVPGVTTTLPETIASVALPSSPALPAVALPSIPALPGMN